MAHSTVGTNAQAIRLCGAALRLDRDARTLQEKLSWI